MIIYLESLQTSSDRHYYDFNGFTKRKLLRTFFGMGLSVRFMIDTNLLIQLQAASYNLKPRT